MKPKLRLSRKLPIAYEMVRLKTVKALGISFPLMHLGPSDGVIEQRPKKSPSRPGLLFALCKNKFLSIAAMHTQLPRWVHQRRFECALATSAFHPIADISLRCAN